MKNKLIVILFAVALVFTACTDNNTKVKEQKSVSNTPNPVKVVSAKVLKHKDVPGYSYMFVSDKGKNYWIAASKMEVNVGDSVFFNGAMEMTNFTSTTLDTTFKSILFVNKCSTNKSDIMPANGLSKEKEEMLKPHSGMISSFHKKAEKDKLVKVNLKKKKGELTIAELLRNRDKYNGKEVTIKGVVVKYLPGIMNKNWIHLQDGTSSHGIGEIVITTLDKVQKGQTVTLKGKLATNVDFGYGYKYNVIIQNADLVM
jgi:hypothetical protein